MKELLTIYIIGVVVFAAAAVWNLLCKSLQIATAYELLTRAKPPRTTEVVLLVVVYPLVLGLSAVVTYRVIF